MKRSVAPVLALSALLTGGLALGSGVVRAGEEGSGKSSAKTSERDVEKKIERKVVVLRGPGRGGFLGVGLEDVEGSTARGARVRSVEPQSAAAAAGVEEGDVIVRFDGEVVRSAAQLARLVRETPAGRSVEIGITRDGSSRTLTATLGKRSGRWLQDEDDGVFVPDPHFDIEIPEPPEPPDAEMPPFAGPMPHVFRWHSDGDRDFTMRWERPRKLGVRYMEIGDQLADYFGLTADQGVLVTSVDEGGPAAAAGLKAGDVILEFDGRAVRRGSDLREQVAEAEGGAEVTIRVQRNGKPLDLKVTLATPETPRRRGAGISL